MLAQQQNQLGYAGLANQQKLTGMQGDISKSLANIQGQFGLQGQQIQQAGATQRTGMEAASAQQIAAGQQSSQTQRTQLEQSGLTEREKMAVQGQLDVTNLTTAEQERVSKYQSDQQLAASKYSADIGLQSTQAQEATKAAALQQSQSRYSQLLPMLQNIYNQSATTGSGNFDVTGGIPAPTIDASPVFTQPQIQQRVNQMRSQTDQGTASQIRNTQKDLSGRGFGSNSPLARSLATQYQGQGLAANTQGENDLRYQLAQANADQMLKGQTAQSGQYQAQLSAATEQQKNKVTQQNALIQALASLAA
jgi:hypothetical protein